MKKPGDSEMTSERESPANGKKFEEAIGVHQDPKEHQKEMMKDQPVNRPQTHGNPAMDKKDRG